MTSTDEQPRFAWISRAAFAIAVAIVVARCLMLEILRDGQIAPAGSPSGPGAATSLVVDWLCLIPIGLLFVRRLFDDSYTLRFTLVHALAVALAVWTLASVAWADDKFAALVGGMNVAGGVALFWTFTQLVRRWDQLRVVAGVAVGILLANVAQAAIFRGVEFPALQEMWAQNRMQIFEQNGWRPDEYAAVRFEKKVLAGEVLGFNASPNTLAAICAMTCLIALGVAAQRVTDRDDPGWTGVCGIIAALTLFPLYYTGSRGAYASLALGLLLLAAWRPTRRWLAAHRPLIFAAGCCAIALAIVAVIAYGLTTGGLPNDSINFRWRYWMGAWPVALENPLLGVGWANFGSHYLAHRVPAAAEEIIDPHNFAVRWTTELGTIGVAIGVAWLGLWAWRAARPPRRATAPLSTPTVAVGTIAYAGLNTSVPPAADALTPTAAHGSIGVVPLLGVIALAFALNLAASVDFAAADADHVNYIIMEVLKRGVLFAAVALALAAVTLTARRDADGRTLIGRHVEERPAPWIAAAMFIGVVMLLLQSTIDIAFFEPAPFTLTLALMGSLIGLAVDDRPPRAESLTLVALITGGIVALSLLVAIVVPVAVAESFARQADDLAPRQPARAITLYERAAGWSPVSNWSYPDRAARVAIGTRDDRAAALLNAVIAADRSRASGYLNRARSRAQFDPQTQAEVIVADYERAIALNPNDVDFRIEYAGVLERLGRPAAASAQLFAALAADDKLDAAEPKRLDSRTPGARESLQAKAVQLQSLTQ